MPDGLSLAGARERLTRYREDLTRRQRYGLVALVLVVWGILPQLTDDFFIMNMLIFVFLFMALGHGWNIIGGYAGQISLGHAVMFATGAYTTAILWTSYGISPIIGLWIAGGMALLVGLGLGAITFSLRYHYFAMATLAAALIAFIVAQRWEFIGGARGIEYPFAETGTLVSLTFATKDPYYYLIGGFAILVTVGMYQLDRSRLGTYLKAINMDQSLAESAGLAAFRYKMYAMGLSSFVTGFTGGLYANYVLYIDPLSTLRVLRNIDIIMIPIIGGIGTVFGAVIGAFVFIPVREVSRTMLSGSHTGLDWVIFGVVLVLISIYRPGGLLNKYSGRWGD